MTTMTNRSVMALTFVLGALLMGLKFGAYALTGSSAIFSDALESIINVAASGFALYSVFLSTRPPDANHPYGHGKIEYFSAGFEGALIVLAALVIFVQAVPRFFDPRPLTLLDQGAGLLALTAVVNLGLALALMRRGKRTHSLAMAAEGKHLLTDVLTTLGVIVGLLLVRHTGLTWIDPAMACLVAANIVYTGYQLVRESMARLMDEADPRLLEHIVDVLNTHRRSDWIHLHRLRARRYGQQVHVDLHMMLPRSYSLQQAHDVVEEIEGVLRENLGPEAEIIVHADPCSDPWCPVCARQGCNQRCAPGEDLPPPLTNGDTGGWEMDVSSP